MHFLKLQVDFLLLSADNDTYHIGLPLLYKHPDKTFFVALDT